MMRRDATRRSFQLQLDGCACDWKAPRSQSTPRRNNAWLHAARPDVQLPNALRWQSNRFVLSPVHKGRAIIADLGDQETTEFGAAFYL
jgi:hypothetical protein